MGIYQDEIKQCLDEEDFQREYSQLKKELENVFSIDYSYFNKILV